MFSQIEEKGRLPMLRIFSMKVIEEDFLEEKWRAYLSESRRLEAEKHHQKKEQQLFLGAEILLNRCLEVVQPNMQRPVSYERNGYGKPYLQTKEKLFVNWSHSGDYVICALADKEVGIDLQEHSKTLNDSLIQKVLQKEELKVYQETPEDEKQQIFYQFWTAKESFLKALGTGFYTPLDKFWIRLNKNPTEIFQSINQRKYFCQFLDFRDKEYTVAVCCEGKMEEVEIEYL